VIGYENLVTPASVSSTTADALWPTVNLANPSTYDRWQGTSIIADEYLTTVVNRVDPVDYIGIARHNLGSGKFPVSVETQATSISSWVQKIAPVLLGDDAPAVFRFVPQSVYAVRLRIQPGAAGVVPRVAVMYVGKLLVLQRRTYAPHTPIKFGRTTRVSNGRSETGNFLGRVILQETNETTLAMTNLTAVWFRTYLDPFLIAAKGQPFFHAWRPASYPAEVGYAWLTGDPRPVNQKAGLINVDLAMGGVI
jgi:hypothetical protein